MFRRTCTAAFAATQVNRFDIFGRQLEFTSPLTPKDRAVQSYGDEYGRITPQPTMEAQHGRMAKYVDPELCKVDTSQEVVLNTYPDGTPFGKIPNQWPELEGKNQGKINGQFFSEEFFRRNVLATKCKAVDEDKRRVIDYAMNSVMFGLSLLCIRFAIVPIWWAGAPLLRMVYLSNLEVEVPELSDRQCMTVVWRGKPVFIYKRSESQMQQMNDTPMSALKDPETDEQRFPDATHRPYAIALGICTHLGCVPIPNEGIYNGFFCPCHGSHYDASARIRIGPAPLNLPVPSNKWLDDQLLYIGKL